MAPDFFSALALCKPVELRPYQIDACDTLCGAIAEHRHCLLVGPTGSGKALLAGEASHLALIAAALGIIPVMRAIIVAPTRELIVQNAQALKSQHPCARVSIACAGLGMRDVTGDIIIGSPGTLANIDLPPIGALVIDEAHSVCGRHKKSRIFRIINACKAKNPKLVVIGMTATDYRLDSGRLSEHSGIWDCVNWEVGYVTLMRQGHLAPLVGPGAAIAKMDASDIRRLGGSGDFIEAELDKHLNNELLNARIAREIVKFGKDRRSWLVFAISVSHAKALAHELKKAGVAAAHIDGGMRDEERDEIIEQFKRGELRAIVNCQILTTGFNHPAIDLVAMARPTCSPGLMVQCIGRGTRNAAGKKNCLILDFANNFDRCGSFDAPMIKDKRSDVAERPTTKECPACNFITSAHAKVCPACDAEFPRDERLRGEEKLTARALNVEPLSGRARATDPDVFDVARVRYAAHRSRQNAHNPASLRIDYYLTNGDRISEWLCIWHGGNAGRRAEAEWRARLQPGAIRTIPTDAYAAAGVAGELLIAPTRVRKIQKTNGLIIAEPIFSQSAPATAPFRNR